MAVATEVVAVRYEDIVAGVGISVPYPVYEALDVQVYYGMAALQAVYNTDYTISLGDDFETFTLTPTASLIAKIDALIALDADETNYITVRRRLDLKTDATAAAVRYTPFTAREFDRTAMRFQQVDERLNRALVLSPSFVGDEPLLRLNALTPGASLRVSDDGTALESGPQIPNIDAQADRAEEEADRAEREANYAEEWAQSPNPISVDAGGDANTDRSAKYWAEQAEQVTLPDGAITDIKVADDAAIKSSKISHTLDATGAVAMPLYLKLGEIFSPTDFGAEPGATASVNQPAFEKAIDHMVATGRKMVTPGGSYAFADTLFVPQATMSAWDNVIMLKQHDGEGIRFGSGPSPAVIDGRLRVDKDVGGSGTGPVPYDVGTGFPTSAGGVDTDVGIVLAGKVIQTGSLEVRRTRGSGVVLEASANSNYSRIECIRGVYTGKYGVEGKLTRNDNAVWDIRLEAYGCWDSGIMLADDYNARGWRGFIGSEANCRKGTGSDCYLGFVNGGELMVYSENIQAGVNEIVLGPNAEYMRIVDVRDNKTVNNSTKPKTIVIDGGGPQRLGGSNPSEGYVRGQVITENIPSRYISKTWEGLLPAILAERRINGNGVKWALEHEDGTTGLLEMFEFRRDGNIGTLRAGKGLRTLQPNGAARVVAPTQNLSAYTPTNVTTDRAFNADTVTITELADVVGTLIADLKAWGILI